MKKHKKLDDILDIAVNDAQIEEQNDEVVSDDDIPLSQRVKEENRRALKKSKRKMNKVVDELVEEEKNDCLENDNLNDTPIFTEGPPPLIPLAIKKDPVENTTAVTRTLPANAPPLIPIKPLSTISPKTILNVLSTETQLKLNCTSCNEQFSSISDLKHHKQFSCQSSALQCNICRKEFKERKRLIGHLKGHMIAKNYRCKVCGKCYPNPSTFRVHMRTHTGERPFKCQICGKGFVRWAGVAEHMKTHTSLKPHVCGTCGKGYVMELYLKYWLSTFSDPSCSFKIQSNLERHKILHTGNLPFCCSYCGKTFSQSDNLQLHVRTYHTYERPFLCYECGKLKTKSFIFCAAIKPFILGKGFVSSTRLKRHMWVHTGYKPYLCEHCPKAYSNSNDLKNHERTHVGGANKTDKPHKCPSCDMRFYHSCRYTVVSDFTAKL